MLSSKLAITNYKLSYMKLKYFRVHSRCLSLTASQRQKQKQKKKSEFTDTVFLPKTTFPGYSDPKNELELQKQSSFKGLYARQRNDPNRTTEFVLHDGPPYANGNPHLGHAVNKITKDIICRYNLIDGKKVHFVPGWDCHGLPIELKAVKSSESLNPVDIRHKARQFAIKTMEAQKKAFQRWGLMCDFDHPYVTMNSDYVIKQLKLFYTFYEQGLIFKDYLPVYWSLCHETALAEAELEYNEEHVSRSAYVRFRIDDINIDGQFRKDLYALIWTTTPWTLIANQAIAYANSATYAIVRIFGTEGNYIVAADIIPELEKTLQKQLVVLKTIEPDVLKSATYFHPVKNRSYKLFAGDHVTLKKGTGLVHCAPYHGKDDYVLSVKHRLDIEPCLVNEKGVFTADAGDELEGKSVLDEGNDIAIGQWKNDILMLEDYQHRYPYDWRSNKPVVVRASQQWFMNIDSVREKCNEVLDGVNFYPKGGLKLPLQTMLRNRPQWCISRQRSWGVPIPAFYDESDKDLSQPIITDSSFNYVLQQLEEHGLDSWWSKSAKDLAHPSLSDKNLVKSNDILDIWFDSGVTWQTVLDGSQVADLYLEGTDQIRGWFQSSLITSVTARGIAPYKSVLVHGFAVDENGKKMSKSVGNVVDPHDVIEGKKSLKLQPNGADVLRWWVLNNGATSGHTIYYSNSYIETANGFHKKARLTLRFLMGALNEFRPQTEYLDYDQLHVTDKIALNRLYVVDQQLWDHFKKYELEDMADLIKTYITEDLSAVYFMATKHRLYCYQKDSADHRSCRTAYYHILNYLCNYLSPIMPHLLAEFYSHFPADWREQESISEKIRQHPPNEWKNDNLGSMFNLVQIISTLINRIDIDLNSKMPNNNVVVVPKENNLKDFLKALQSEKVSNSSSLCEYLRAASVSVETSAPDNSKLSVPILSDLEDENAEELGRVYVTESNLFLCPRCRRKVSANSGRPCDDCLLVLASQYQK